MYKVKDAAELRNKTTAAIQAAIEETLQHPIYMKVNASSITHTGLQPEGDQFTITFNVTVLEKKTK